MSVTGVLDRALGRLDPRLSEAFLRAGAEAGAAPPGTFDDPDTPAPAEAVMERLADAGFLEDGPPGPYRMHELLRAYARRTTREHIRRTEKV